MRGYETKTRDDGGGSGSTAAMLGVAFGAVAIGAFAVDPTAPRGGRGFAVIVPYDLLRLELRIGNPNPNIEFCSFVLLRSAARHQTAVLR